MVIYSHNLHEKLFGYAISREFIKYQTPFCDLLDDPTLALDFDLAINFNQALNGNADARTNFTNTLILCSTDLDVTSLEFYKAKMEAYPIFFSEIARINYTFGNLQRLPSDNGGFIDQLKRAVAECLNSPCNLFTQSSTSIGKLAQGPYYASENTVLPVGSLKNTFATFAGGIDSVLFNKIPEIFQKSVTNLKLIGKNAWSESATMLTKDDLPTLIAKAQSGTSLRNNTAGYRWTPDLKSYLDLSSVASDVLGNIASDMGDCFRRYQQSYRYNPYDPKQNQSSVAKAPIADQVNGTTYHRNTFGQPVEGNVGGKIPKNLSPAGKGNKQTVNIPEGTFVSDYIDFQSERDPNMLTVYGGHIDANNNWYQDLTLDSGSEKGDIAAGGSTYISGPMTYNNYKQFENDGFTTSTDLINFEKKKFNLGVAINFTSLAKYLNQSGRASYTVPSLYKYFHGKTKADDERIYVEITPEGKAPVYVKVFDIAGSPNRIDFTVPTFIQVFGMNLVTSGRQVAITKKTSTKPAVATKSVETAKFDGHTVITSFSLPLVKCKARFIVGKLSDVGSNNEDCDKKAQYEIDIMTQSVEVETMSRTGVTISSATMSAQKVFNNAVAAWKTQTDPDKKWCILLLVRSSAALFLDSASIDYATASIDDVLRKLGNVPSEVSPEGVADVTKTIRGFATSSKESAAYIRRFPTDCGKGIQC